MSRKRRGGVYRALGVGRSRSLGGSEARSRDAVGVERVSKVSRDRGVSDVIFAT